MQQGSDCTAPRHPAGDIATSFIFCSRCNSCVCRCVIPLCVLISSGGVSDELNEILMRVSPRVRGRRRRRQTPRCSSIRLPLRRTHRFFFTLHTKKVSLLNSRYKLEDWSYGERERLHVYSVIHHYLQCKSLYWWWNHLAMLITTYVNRRKMHQNHISVHILYISASLSSQLTVTSIRQRARR